MSYKGKGSWFGGPADSMDSGRTASGGTTAEPGVAIRLPGRSWRDSRKYLGGYWRVTAPNGRTAVLKQTDLGPNESTGRNVDVTYSALGKLGYNQGNFPTDAQFRYEYIGKNPGKGGGSSPQRTTTTTTGPDYKAQARRQAAAQWLLQGGRDPIQLATSVNAAEDAAPAQQRTTTTSGGSMPAQSGGFVDRVTQRASAIDAQKLPYKWGGGHGGQTKLHDAVPLDCSGAVSKALGIDPRVSGQFTTWGRPGRAPKGKGVTIYANGTHVLMEVNGRFWGTSGSNPGGGAGWIPRAKITPQYLAGFTARHSARR